MEFIDLTHPFTADMPVYPGDPAATLSQSSFLDTAGCNDFFLHTGMHVGTHIDAPFHMLANGLKLPEFPPEKFFGQGILIDARGHKMIDVDLLKNVQLDAESVVLVFTGRSGQFGQPDYFKTWPEISLAFAQKLVDSGVKMLGLDSPSPDHEPFAIHKLLLGHDILLLENLTNLEKLLPVSNFEIIALPPKLVADAAPVRVVAKILRQAL